MAFPITDLVQLWTRYSVCDLPHPAQGNLGPRRYPNQWKFCKCKIRIGRVFASFIENNSPITRDLSYVGARRDVRWEWIRETPRLTRRQIACMTSQGHFHWDEM